MNFIFDIGNVLIDFKPESFLRDLLDHEENERKMLEVIFKSQEWIRLDAGTLTHEEACSIFCAREPQHQALIQKVMDHIPEMLTPIEQTVAQLPKIKDHGHKLYYLSNYHTKLSAYILDKYAFFGLFDGGVFSCDVHINKPDEGIYHALLKKYDLVPQDCVFFDDSEANIIAAKEIGMQGVVFTDASQIEPYI